MRELICSNHLGDLGFKLEANGNSWLTVYRIRDELSRSAERSKAISALILKAFLTFCVALARQSCAEAVQLRSQVITRKCDVMVELVSSSLPYSRRFCCLPSLHRSALQVVPFRLIRTFY